MQKNKIIIFIISFYIFWIGILPLLLTKAFEVLCANITHNSSYEIVLKSPRVILSLLPRLTFQAEKISIASKDKSIRSDIDNFKIKIRILPILSGKLHINSISVGDFEFSALMKERFSLDKDFFNKLKNTPIKLDSININNFNMEFYQINVKKPVTYKGKDFSFQHKNRYIKLKTDSSFEIMDNISKSNIDLYLPKNNNIKDTVFNIQLANLNISPFKIYLKHYLPADLEELNGIINIEANKNELAMTCSNCSVIMQDGAKSIIFPKDLSIKSKFDIKKHFIKFDNIDITAPNIKLGLDGKIFDYLGSAMPTIDFNIRLDKSKIEDLIKLLPAFNIEEINTYKLKKYNFYGDILANINVKGRLPEPEILGDIFIDNGILIKPLPNTSKGATIKVELLGKQADFDVVVPCGGIEKVYVIGTQELYNIKFADIKIKSTSNVDLHIAQAVLNPLHEILNFIIGPLPIMDLYGKGNIDIIVKGNRKNPHVWGVFNAYEANAGFKKLKGLNIEKSDTKLIFNDQNVEFIGISTQMNGKKIVINGIFDLFGKFDFKLSSSNQPFNKLYTSIKKSEMVAEIAKMLPAIDKIEGFSDFDLNVYGNVKTLNDIRFNENTFMKGNLILKDNDLVFEGIDVQKTNGIIKFDSDYAEADIKAMTAEAEIKLFAKIKNNIADILLEIPRLNPNKLINKNIKGQYLLPFISLNLKYKGNIQDIEYEKLDIDSKILESYPNSKLIFNSGSFLISNNKLTIKSLNGYLDNIKNKFSLDIKAEHIFSKKPNVTGNIKLELTDLVVLNNLYDILPNNYKNLLNKYEFKSGKIDFEGKINNNNINASSDLSGIALVYTPLEMPINIINGNLFIKNNNLYLNKFNMLADEMPVLLDGNVKDILDKQNFNIYINAKPQQDFIDKYVNINRVYPIKIKGDIVSWVRLKGNKKDYEIKSNLQLSKDSSIYYLGATVGDVENDIIINFDSRIANNKHFKIKDFSYDKLIDSQNGKSTRLNLLKSWGNATILENDLLLKDLFIKTENPTDARIFNVIFRKPNIKQGLFTSDLKFNGKLSNPTVLGNFHIFETNIPFLDTNMKNIELNFKDKFINIESKGEVMGNDLSFEGVLKNKLSQPYHLEKGVFYTENLDLNNIFDKLKISQVDDIDTFDSFGDFKLNSISFKNLKFKADNIVLRNIQATDYEALTSLTENGVFSVKDFKFNIAQGALNGNYKYDLKTNDMRLNLEAEKIDANDMAVALFDLNNQIYGDLTGQINLSCNGTNFEHCMETLSGNTLFNVKDGRMPKLGSLEYLLKAGNLVKGGLTGLSINSVVELISPLKTGEFSDIFGSIRIKDGMTRDLEITTKGKDLSLFVSGTYNFATSVADMEVYGLLSKKMSTFLGPIGNISINTLFNVIPGVDLSKDSVVLEKINKIPGLELSSKDFRKFLAEIKGNINGENYVTSFKWIN